MFLKPERQVFYYFKAVVLTARSTSTCCRRPCEKKSKARTPSRAGRLVSRDVSGQLPAGLSVGPRWAGLLVSAKSGQRSNGVTNSHAGSRAGSASVWLPADLGTAPA
jgi:hypothetical protein